MRLRLVSGLRVLACGLAFTWCGTLPAAMLVESGGLAAEVQRLKALAFASASGRYVAPTDPQMAQFAALASAVRSGDLLGAEAAAATLDYELVEFTDVGSGRVFHQLREELVAGETTRGWGSFFYHPGFTTDALVEVPHTLADTHTEAVGAKVFFDCGARGLLMAGAHRNANGTGTADVAHLTNTIFHVVHQAWVGNPATTPAWQIHAFDLDGHPSFPAGTDAVLSNGDGGVSAEIVALDGQLGARGYDSYAFNELAVDAPLNVSVNGPVVGTTFAGLGAKSNVQGDDTRDRGGLFVHVELEQSIRFDPVQRDIAATAIAGTLAGGYEGDVAPRTGGSFNGSVTIADWVQVGRFVAGLDVPANSAEFQRADCAPRASRGGGGLSISDWVQAGRYAAGLDPVPAAGGVRP